MNNQLNPNHIKRYNDIPKEILNGKLFEIGAGTGEHQFASKHKEFFLSNNYLGIDSLAPVLEREKMVKGINIIEANIFDFDIIEGKYDSVIAIEIMEHIIITKWKELIQIMKDLLKTGGCLYITVPYNEKARFYKRYTPHLVFGITKAIFRELLPEAEFRIGSHYGLFRGTEEDYTKTTLKTILRGFRRIIFERTYSSYLFHNLIIKWRKEGNYKMNDLRTHFENRYYKKLGSGKGSVGQLREFKHKILNQYLINYNKFRFVDFGCGDLSFWHGKPPKYYTGIDFARNIQKENAEKFDREFITSNLAEVKGLFGEVVICFDVLFHILDEEVYFKILRNICNTSSKWIFIYTWIKESNNYMKDHQKYRNFENYLYIFHEYDFTLRFIHYNKKIDKIGALIVFEKKESD